MIDTLTNKHLPDFTKKKISKEEAAEQLYQALCKEAKEVGHDPKWEVSKQPYEENKKAIHVLYEAGPYDWGVSYSLSSHPKSYDMMNNPQDWYLETHWGFDVIFCDK
tara:strand:+ start:65 stop:385 length:321 start_codon:yes stop_codon:yes gene_type:complete